MYLIFISSKTSCNERPSAVACTSERKSGPGDKNLWVIWRKEKSTTKTQVELQFAIALIRIP